MMIPPHEVNTPEKLRWLVESIGRNGWQGKPLVVDGQQLITGTHRYAACQELGWSDEAIPTIELAVIFEEAGLNMAEIYQKHGYPTVDNPEYKQFLIELPKAIRKKHEIETD